ncbi:protein THEM6-like isoform X2 [Agrilus planipennis]|uniref:Protein THEM6 n=1 Tax=Agrilus planipennis TaxID=224129 RepID=A0A7F5QZU7_AGRPL|nr:protein THEM6-like isoform X2 [Agrilus planipennis]
MTVCYIVGAFLVAVVVLYGLLELHYFLRTFLSVLLARFCKKKVHILQETVVKGICLTSDIDTFLYHMNNARFMRELDFARADFYERTGLFRTIKAKGGSIAICATTIRYRRFLKLFSRYFITSKLLYWDNKSFYLQYKFITKGGLINAFVIQEVKMINCTCESILESISQRIKQTVKKPEPPEFLVKWIEGNSNLQDDKSASITTITTM